MLLVSAFAAAMSVQRCCWIATHSKQQRWGSAGDRIRHKTDFNAVALERTPDYQQLSNGEKLARAA